MGHKVWGHDPNPEAVHGVIHSSTISALYKNCDALVLALPSYQHCVELMEAPRHLPVLIEKPIGYGEGDVRYLDDCLHERSAPTMVGTNLRFHSCVKKAKEWLAEGLIGNPLWASFCVAQHNTKYTDPVVLNWGAHEIDLALYLLGPATVTAAAGNDQIMDVCLLHEYGVPSRIHMDYVTPVEKRGFSICCTKGNLIVDLVDRIVRLARADDSYLQDIGTDSFDQNYIEEMQAFIDLVDGKPVPHAATGADGLACLELILEAQRMANK